MYQIIFAVRCEACNQVLEPLASSEGVEYRHGNIEDCSESGVTLPHVSTEQISSLFAETVATKQRKVQAKEIDKAAAKKKAK